MNLTFRGGVHPKGRKELSREAPLRRFDPSPGEMVFPLAQHIGKPANAIVKKNDPVLVLDSEDRINFSIPKWTMSYHF